MKTTQVSSQFWMTDSKRGLKQIFTSIYRFQYFLLNMQEINLAVYHLSNTYLNEYLLQSSQNWWLIQSQTSFRLLSNMMGSFELTLNLFYLSVNVDGWDFLPLKFILLELIKAFGCYRGHTLKHFLSPSKRLSFALLTHPTKTVWCFLDMVCNGSEFGWWKNERRREHCGSECVLLQLRGGERRGGDWYEAR